MSGGPPSDAPSEERSPARGWRRRGLPATPRRRALSRPGRWRGPSRPDRGTDPAHSCRSRRRAEKARCYGRDRGPDHVLPPDRERVDAQFAGQFVDGGLDGERGLRGAISPERTRGHRIRVDRIADALLVGAAVGGHRGAERRGEDLAAVVAVGSGIGDGVDLHRRERAVLLRAQLDRDLHRMAADRRGELLGAGELPLHRAAGLQRRQHAQVLGQQFLLAAEPASDVFGEDVDLVGEHAEEVGELDLGEVGGLRAGADMDAPVLATPGDRAVGLHVCVLDLGRRVRAFVARRPPRRIPWPRRRLRFRSS